LLKTNTKYLEGRLKLRVNAEKSKAVSVVAIRNFKFLGFAMGRNKNGYFIRVHAKSMRKAKQKMQELTSRSQDRNVRVVMNNLKVHMTGWLTYLGIERMKKQWQNGTAAWSKNSNEYLEEMDEAETATRGKGIGLLRVVVFLILPLQTKDSHRRDTMISSRDTSPCILFS
jgi:Rod binding domain-containing protein